MRKKLLAIVAKWGVISTAGLALLELVKYYARLIDYPFQAISALAFILMMLVLLYLCIKEVRDKVYDGQITFARAFSTGALMILTAALLLFFYLTVQYTYIDKNAEEYPPRWCIETQALRDGMPHFTLIDGHMDSLKEKEPHYKTPAAAAFSYAIFTVLLYGLFFSIFVAFYLYRKKEDRKQDTE